MARNPYASYEASDHQRMPLTSIFMDKVYGQNGNSINIDRINNSKGYVYRVITGSDFSGTSPISVIGGGNSFLLMGFSQVTNNLIQYGVQIAFGFGGTRIAIRNRNYVASGGEWEAWTAV